MIEDQDFSVSVRSGDVFINGKFVAQLCYNEDSVGYAVSSWLKGDCDEEDVDG